MASVRSEDGSLATRGPFCDVNIIKRPPAYLRAARKRPLRGGLIRARALTTPGETRGLFREGEGNPEERREETTVRVRGGEGLILRPRSQAYRWPKSWHSLSSPLPSAKTSAPWRVLYELPEPRRVDLVATAAAAAAASSKEARSFRCRASVIKETRGIRTNRDESHVTDSPTRFRFNGFARRRISSEKDIYIYIKSRLSRATFRSD